MTEDVAFEVARGIILRTFATDDITINSIPDDVHGWDSLGHLRLIAELESVIGRELGVDEVMSIDSIRRLVAVIAG